MNFQNGSARANLFRKTTMFNLFGFSLYAIINQSKSIKIIKIFPQVVIFSHLALTTSCSLSFYIYYAKYVFITTLAFIQSESKYCRQSIIPQICNFVHNRSLWPQICDKICLVTKLCVRFYSVWKILRCVKSSFPRFNWKFHTWCWFWQIWGVQSI